MVWPAERMSFLSEQATPAQERIATNESKENPSTQSGDRSTVTQNWKV